MSDIVDNESCEGCSEYNVLSRRRFLAGGAGAAAAASTLFPIFPSWLPQVVLADSADTTRDVIVSVFLRGGCDGLSIVVPFFDPAYYTGRPTIAIARPDSSDPNRGTALDDRFMFPPAMGGLLPAYHAGHLLAIQATGSIDPSRSHFDAQRYMEVGKPADATIATGWLGRHLASVAPMRTGATLRALGLSSGLQKTLVGAPQALPIPDPANFAISGQAATQSRRQDWLRQDFEMAAEPVRSAALDALNTINLLTAINFGAYVPATGATYQAPRA